jgi:hypothetical protein
MLYQGYLDSEGKPHGKGAVLVRQVKAASSNVGDSINNVIEGITFDNGSK